MANANSSQNGSSNTGKRSGTVNGVFTDGSGTNAANVPNTWLLLPFLVSAGFDPSIAIFLLLSQQSVAGAGIAVDPNHTPAGALPSASVTADHSPSNGFSSAFAAPAPAAAESSTANAQSHGTGAKPTLDNPLASDAIPDSHGVPIASNAGPAGKDSGISPFVYKDALSLPSSDAAETSNPTHSSGATPIFNEWLSLLDPHIAAAQTTLSVPSALSAGATLASPAV